MKDVFKALLLLLAASSAFFIGFFLGEEKIKAKISNFQGDVEERK